MESNNSLYIHVPFCRTKCRYCDFYSRVETDKEKGRAFLAALARNLETHRDKAPFSSIYVGGGTPSVLPQEDFSRLLDLLGPLLIDGGEWSIEANPESLDQDKCAAMRTAGVTRLSLGIQSLQDRDRHFLDRAHDAAGARKALALAGEKGPAEISADLLLGLPEQTDEEVAGQVQELVAAGVNHLSFYLLTVEEGTPLAAMVAAGKTNLPSPTRQAEIFRFCRRLLKSMDLPPYEISNAARPGKECLHNLRYWRGGDFLGLGPSAASMLAGERSRNLADLDAWLRAIEKGESPLEFHEHLTPPQAAGERTWLMLRTTAGVDLAEVVNLTGCGDSWLQAANKQLEQFKETGLVATEGSRFCLTEEGILQGDGVGAAFLSLEE